MKKLNMLAGILGSVIIAGSMIGSVTASAATSKIIANVYQYSQQKGWWCGYASMESALNNEYYRGNMVPGYNYWWSQTNVADAAHNYNNRIVPYNPKDKDWSPFPWYIGGNSHVRNQKYYPAGGFLNSKVRFTWIALGNSFPDFSKENVKKKLMSTLDSGHAVLCCGISNSRDSSHMPNYPAGAKGHWVACDGYSNSGNTILIVDPAANSVCIGYDSVRPYYSVSLDKFYAFASGHGIIW